MDDNSYKAGFEDAVLIVKTALLAHKEPPIPGESVWLDTDYTAAWNELYSKVMEEIDGL